jgi:hypothetical protein
MSFVLPRRRPGDPDEGLVFAAAPDGALIVQICMSPERLAGYTLERPCSVPIPADAALELAHALLREFSPSVADFLERAALAASLRVVAGGSRGTPEAS